MRAKYRLSFRKTGPVCFLGHLDLLKMFQGSVKRAKLPIAYSNGFNPHQLMSFALPLPLGMEGLCEYVDIVLDAEMDTGALIENINSALPEGIVITAARLMEEGEKSSAALINKAIFDVTIPYNADIYIKLDEIISSIIKAEEITVTKRTKSGMKESDIRKDIFEITNRSQESAIVLELLLAAGSMKNLKPDVVIEYIFNEANVEFKPYEIKYSRREQLLL